MDGPLGSFIFIGFCLFVADDWWEQKTREIAPRKPFREGAPRLGFFPPRVVLQGRPRNLRKTPSGLRAPGATPRPVPLCRLSRWRLHFRPLDIHWPRKTMELVSQPCLSGPLCRVPLCRHFSGVVRGAFEKEKTGQDPKSMQSFRAK